MTTAELKVGGGPSGTVGARTTCASLEQEPQDTSIAVEQGLPRPVVQRLAGTDGAGGQRLTRDDNVVEQRFPRGAANVLSGVVERADADEQDKTMDHGLPPTVEHELPRVVRRALLMTEAGESHTPLHDAEDELRRLYSAGMIEHDLSSPAWVTLHARSVVAVGAIRDDPVPYHWTSVSMDFVFGLSRGATVILVFVGRFDKIVHLFSRGTLDRRVSVGGAVP
ncbi:hypothetical protein DVH05_010730 [Phytophthora capsici]|nr:hypothetical protein DVH05_010730 [Phytophthora capsici]